MFIIIPAKPLARAKTRLATVLSPQERLDLSRHLFQRTLAIARQVGEVVVISRDSHVRRLAKQAGAWALVEAGTGLNEALRQAADWTLLRQAAGILILPGDLPRLSSEALREMINLGQKAPAVVIAPCRREEGTNALLLRPPDFIEVAFGPGSFKEHQRLAQVRGLNPLIYRSPSLALDLDWPEDLVYYQGMTMVGANEK
jgi:2-phospho-L-lactate guanylyltransferase